MTLGTSKTLILAKTFIDFCKSKIFDTTMVLKAFWCSLGLLVGALGGLLGALLGLQIDPKGLERSDPFALWALWGLSFSSFSSFGVLLLASCCSSFFEVVFDPLLEPFRVDYELPR